MANTPLDDRHGRLRLSEKCTQWGLEKRPEVARTNGLEPDVDDICADYFRSANVIHQGDAFTHLQLLRARCYSKLCPLLQGFAAKHRKMATAPGQGRRGNVRMQPLAQHFAIYTHYFFLRTGNRRDFRLKSIGFSM